MRPVSVRILHPEPDPAAGPLGRWVAEARRHLAEDHRVAFLAAGATDASIVSGPPDDTPFGARLRAIVRADRPAGLIVLGSGAIPLATARDRRNLVTAAGDPGRIALANNRYSADVVAVARAETLAEVPDLPGDNALPRWLEEVADYEVRDLRRRWHLAIDIDGPLELLLLGYHAEAGDPNACGIDLAPASDRRVAIRGVAEDRRGELLVAGRTSAATLAWLEGHAAARVRAWVEERGLRANSRLAQSRDAVWRDVRPPGSVLGALLEHDGPGSLGDLLARFGDAAIVDSRVLIAHRFGPDETAWPIAEDRFASDLLLPHAIADPWLRELTASAAAAPIPILLGGHTLVGPGVRLVVGKPSARGARWTRGAQGARGARWK